MANILRVWFLTPNVLRFSLAILAFFYSQIIRWRRLRDDREIEAVAPLERRIIYQFPPLTGRDSFLFHRDQDVLDQLAANMILRQRQIEVWTDALRARLQWSNANGSAMRFLIIPEKHIVYREKLPRFVRLSPQRAALRLLGSINPDLKSKTLYPVHALREASKTKPTFFKTDTHWTSYGAFVAYRALMDSLAPEISLETVSEDELVWSERPYVGDLGVRFQQEKGETMVSTEPTSVYNLTFNNNNFGRGAVHIYENERRDLPTCVLFRDSFSTSLLPYLMRSFSRLVAVSSLSCHYDLLDQEKPDVVLFVVIERFIATFGTGNIIELPQDDSGIAFEAFSGTGLTALERIHS